MTNDIEQIFIYLLFVYILWRSICLSQCLFFNQVVCFFVVQLQKLFLYSGYQTLIRYFIFKYIFYGFSLFDAQVFYFNGVQSLFLSFLLLKKGFFFLMGAIFIVFIEFVTIVLLFYGFFWATKHVGSQLSYQRWNQHSLH